MPVGPDWLHETSALKRRSANAKGSPLSKYKFEPMDLANMRQNGVRSLLIMCRGCPHEVVFQRGEQLVRHRQGTWIRLAEEEM